MATPHGACGTTRGISNCQLAESYLSAARSTCCRGPTQYGQCQSSKPVPIRLQLGGRWAWGYLAVLLSYFARYDFSIPQHLNELIPITTQEVKLTGNSSFPLKERYEAHKRMLPNCIIRPASY